MPIFQLYPSLKDRLSTQHFSIRELIRYAEGGHLIVPPAEGKWSARDNIAHLARYQPVFRERINQIISGNSTSFKRYKAEDDPAFEAWRSRSLNELLDTLETDRQKLAELVLKLTDQQLQCTGHHPKYGTMNVLQWTEFFLLHEAHHIFTVFQIVHTIPSDSH